MNAEFNRVRTIAWRDLVPLNAGERVWELTLPLPWLALGLWCYHHGWWPAGLFCSFYFFLTGLRQSHNAQHCALGLSRSGHDCVLFILSILMLASMHAVQVTHLHHHRYCLQEEDAEGATARLPGWKSFLVGPLFACRLHRSAWRLAEGPQRSWIAVELWSIGAILLLSLIGDAWIAWRWHLSAMLVGERFTAFFAVWTVHHGCKHDEPGRTQRGWLVTVVSYSMFFHAEHHLFPAVPTIHLHELAQRLDRAFPDFQKRNVIAPLRSQT